MTDEDSPDPSAALAWARELHADQSYGHLPYAVHLDAVADVLRQFGHGDDPVLMSAGYLHDAIEDQGVTREQIAARFGERVADDRRRRLGSRRARIAGRRRPRPTRGSATSTTP